MTIVVEPSWRCRQKTRDSARVHGAEALCQLRCLQGPTGRAQLHPRLRLAAACGSPDRQGAWQVISVGCNDRDQSQSGIHSQLPTPSASDPAEIAAILDALDDRIALLRETNATLEAIAQALFKSWFVDFDPVRAKMEGRAPEGMDEATAALFPDGFEESALGLVPRGWRPSTLGRLTADYGVACKPVPSGASCTPGLCGIGHPGCHAERHQGPPGNHGLGGQNPPGRC